MAVTKPARPKRRFHFGWRGLVVFLLTFIGFTALLGYGGVHWTERQILTTDNWIKIVGPLPKNEAVASSLSDYSVNQLFTNIDLEAKITQALPDKAAFLAPPLVDRLETRTKDFTQKIIQSDRFSAIWISANTVAHSKLMATARNDSPPAKKADTRFNLDLSSFKDTIRTRLGKSSNTLFNDSKPAGADVNVNLDFKTKFENFKKFVKAVDFLNGVLGLLAVACLLGAITVSYQRRRLLMIISLLVVVLALLQLIGIKAGRPAMLDHIQNSSYKPAVGVIYDALLGNYRRAATSVAVISALLFIVTYFTQGRFVRNSSWLTAQLKTLKRSRVGNGWKDLRSYIRRYRLPIMGAVTILWLALMALALELDWQGLVRWVLYIILVIELVNLLAARTKLSKAT